MSTTSPDLFVIAATGKRLECWNATEQKQVDRSSFSVHSSSALTLSTDRSIVCAADPNQLVVCRLLDGPRFAGTPLRTIPLAQQPRSICFFPMSSRVAVACESSSSIAIVDTESGDQIASLDTSRHVEDQRHVQVLAVSPDGRRVATHSACGRSSRCFHIWDSTSFEILSMFPDELDRADSNVSSLQWSPCGCKLVAGGYARVWARMFGYVRIWVPSVGQCLHDLRGHDFGVSCMAVSPSGSHIASCSNVPELFVHDAVKGITLGRLSLRSGQHEPSGGMNDLSFSPDSKLLCVATGDRDKGILVYDVVTGQRVCTFLSASHSYGVRSIVAFTVTDEDDDGEEGK